MERVQANLDHLRALFANLTATSPGLDPLGTLIRVSRAYPGPAHLILVTSGLSTQAPLDLRELGWDQDPGIVTTWLHAHEQLPALTGWTIDLFGIGDVGGHQEQPQQPAVVRLRALWLAVCQATGATCSVSDQITGSTWPIASNVVPGVPLPVVESTPTLVIFPGALFEIDRAELGQNVDQDLRAVVARVQATGEHVQVTGRTDAVTGTADHNLRLSQRRAQTLARRLIDLGLPADHVSATGIGDRNSDPGAERADPRIAAQDRRVDITFTPARPSFTDR